MIGNTVIDAMVMAVSEAGGPVPDVVHAIADSLFEVTFHLDLPARIQRSPSWILICSMVSSMPG